ncbi:unnamed protein product [Moneuplotes crassus]|uniref:Enkurin domain-containing protein n=1 Tax=Euplotes crassus TaxID=5936 RepID=A0AAD1XP20_EUPCR|nr:unnamed protein product [Moneuplotes crassus]
MRSLQQVQRREKKSLNYAFQPKENFDSILAHENRKKFKKQYKEMLKRKQVEFQKKKAEKDQRDRESQVKPVKRNWRVRAGSYVPFDNKDTRNHKVQNYRSVKKSCDQKIISDSKDTSFRGREAGILSMAGNSLINRKNSELQKEEARLIQDYYKNYKKPHRIHQSNLKKKKFHNMSHSPSLNKKHSIKNSSFPGHKDSQLLSEEERVQLIAKLDKRKQDIWAQLHKLPVCNRSPGVILKEKELFDELDQVSSDAVLLYNDKIYVA